VLYDRDGTAMRQLTADTFDWPQLMEGHTAALSGGITCALGDGAATAVQALFAEARRRGARTAFDVNHRSRLWSWEEAAPILRDVLPGVDILLASRHDLEHLLDREDEQPTALARRAIDTFGHNAVVLRDSLATGNGRMTVTVTAVTADAELTSHAYEAEIVDAFGAGDAALGALLAAVLAGEDVERAIDQAAWACAFQHTTPGDAWQGRPADLEQRGLARRVLR
jgi:2-dehydro-3-deoxygluconokinase